MPSIWSRPQCNPNAIIWGDACQYRLRIKEVNTTLLLLLLWLSFFLFQILQINGCEKILNTGLNISHCPGQEKNQRGKWIRAKYSGKCCLTSFEKSSKFCKLAKYKFWNMSSLKIWLCFLEFHYMKTIEPSPRELFQYQIPSYPYKNSQYKGKMVLWLSHLYINGLVQDCNISSAHALEILQSCTKKSIWECPYIQNMVLCTKLSHVRPPLCIARG